MNTTVQELLLMLTVVGIRMNIVNNNKMFPVTEGRKGHYLTPLDGQILPYKKKKAVPNSFLLMGHFKLK